MLAAQAGSLLLLNVFGYSLLVWLQQGRVTCQQDDSCDI